MLQWPSGSTYTDVLHLKASCVCAGDQEVCYRKRRCENWRILSEMSACLYLIPLSRLLKPKIVGRALTIKRLVQRSGLKPYTYA